MSAALSHLNCQHTPAPLVPPCSLILPPNALSPPTPPHMPPLCPHAPHLPYSPKGAGGISRGGSCCGSACTACCARGQQQAQAAQPSRAQGARSAAILRPSQHGQRHCRSTKAAASTATGARGEAACMCVLLRPHVCMRSSAALHVPSPVPCDPCGHPVTQLKACHHRPTHLETTRPSPFGHTCGGPSNAQAT